MTDLIEFRHYEAEITKAKVLLMDKKNKDYANSEDVHANFKRLARLCDTLDVDVRKPDGCIKFLILLKVDRFFKLWGTTPENEGLMDTNIDLEIYSELLATLEE